MTDVPTPRRRLPALAVVVGLLIALLAAGCSAGSSVDQVTVKAGTASVVLPAALSCYTPKGATTMSCAGGENDDHAPHLALAPGTPVTVEVPQSVGDTPWVIVFSYVDAAGKAQGDRTAVFAPKKQYSFVLTPPAGAQLTRLEVQSLTASPGADGGIEFPATGSWVLLVDPVGGHTGATTAAATNTPGTASAPAGADVTASE